MSVDGQSDRGGAEIRTSRRRALGAGTFGLVTLGLPTASSASSAGVQSEPVVQPSAPTGLSGSPIGYVSGGTTGAIRLSWSSVAGATSYQVGYSTSSEGPFTSTANTSGTETTIDITGLPGTSTTYYFVVRTNSGGTLSSDSSVASSSNVIATGGTVASFVGNGTIGVNGTRYVVHSFTSTGSSSFTLNRTIGIEHLIVAGGGGGGSRHGGGGGAGGLITNVGSATSRAASGTPYPIVVGSGGDGTPQHTNVSPVTALPTAGGSSSAFGLTATGGGRGSSPANGSGGDGGSGGGSSPRLAAATVGAGTAGQGNDGGTGRDGTGNWAGGGGGGAGAAGGSVTLGTMVGAAGGAGVSNSITGTALSYAGGGGGAGANGGGSGGSGGGGAGSSSGAGSNGTANTGGGGGSGNFSDATNFKGGDGGSGVVVLRYAIPA